MRELRVAWLARFVTLGSTEPINASRSLTLITARLRESESEANDEALQFLPQAGQAAGPLPGKPRRRTAGRTATSLGHLPRRTAAAQPGRRGALLRRAMGDRSDPQIRGGPDQFLLA